MSEITAPTDTAGADPSDTTPDGAVEAHGGEHAVAVAAAHGVDTMFTLSGAHVFPMYDGAVKADPAMRILDVRHEQTAVFAADAVEKCLRLDFGQAVCGTVGATGRAIHVAGVQRSLDPMTDLIRSVGITAYACEPLIAGGEVIGTLSFGSRTRTSFNSEDLRFFASIARLVAAARARPVRRSEDGDAIVHKPFTNPA